MKQDRIYDTPKLSNTVSVPFGTDLSEEKDEKIISESTIEKEYDLPEPLQELEYESDEPDKNRKF